MNNTQNKQDNFMNDLKDLADKVLFLSTELPFSLSVLDRLLDAATMLTVCEKEYPDYIETLSKYAFIYEYLGKVLDVFDEYGMKIILHDTLSERMCALLCN